MTTPFRFVVLAALGASLSACGGQAAASPAANPNNTNNTTVNPAATQTGATPVASIDAQGFTVPNFGFQLTTNQAFSITLPGYGTAGYSWHLDAGADTRIATATGPSRLGSVPGNGTMVGASAPEIFDFKAGAAGTTALHFSLYRPWEGAAAATEKRQFGVTVK